MDTIKRKPKLKDLSQGSRIAFARYYRNMTQHELSNSLGLTGACKRRTMTRYEKGQRNPKEDRTKEIAKILNVSYNSIKQYDFKNSNDIFYVLMWLEELYPNFGFKMDLPNNNKFNKALFEWNEMKNLRKNKKITYEKYIEWKLLYEFKDSR